MNADMLNEIKEIAREINNCKTDLGRLNLYFKYSDVKNLTTEKLETLRIDMENLINNEKVKFPKFILVGFLVILGEIIFMPVFISKLVIGLVLGIPYLVQARIKLKYYLKKRNILNKDKEEAQICVDEIKSVVKYRKGKVKAVDVVESKDIYTVNYFNNLINFIMREIDGVGGDYSLVLRQEFGEVLSSYENIIKEYNTLKDGIIKLGEIADTILELKEGTYPPIKGVERQLKIN